MNSFEQFVNEVVTWQRETFPQSTTESVLSHLREEIQELQDDRSSEEAADVLLLLLAFADKEGFDLLEAAQQKMTINKQRQWTVTAQGGHTKHQATS